MTAALQPNNPLTIAKIKLSQSLSYCEIMSYKGHSFIIGALLTMKKKATRRAWTTEHVRELKSLAKKKAPATKIAKSLKRSEGATRQKAFSLGLSLDFGN